MTKRKGKGAYMISVVAEMYEIHPQTLRLYEREGLLKPSLGVNIAGIGIILNMRERIEQMQQQMQEFVQYVQQEVWNRAQAQMPKDAIVPMRRPVVIPPKKERR
jgi:MerR family transcriptional regulator/heat shock protein HspR